MAIVSVLLVLLAEWGAPELERLRRHDWYARYHAWLEQRLAERAFWDSPLGLLLVLGVPVMLLIVLQSLLALVLFGLPVFLLALAVLFLTLGPTNLLRQARDYIRADEEEAEAQARLTQASEISGSHSEDVEEANADVRDAILGQANDRLFGVLFWFMLLGPAGALLYRLAVEAHAYSAPVDTESDYGESSVAEDTTGGGLADSLTRGSFAEAAERLHGILAWIPARLLALAYALTGSFEDTLVAWRDQLDHAGASLYDNTLAVLVAAGRGALRLEPGQAGPQCGIRSVHSALKLVERSLIVWVVLLALMTLVGWVV